MSNTAQLYVVALPIGNHSDISHRAIEVLGQVDCVAAEDTRKIKILAQHHRINMKQVLSHHNHNETESLEGIVKLIDQGKSVALVSDAGTPNICDPGYKLIRECFKRNIKMTALPGASALITCLSICPLGGIDHYFGGFLPSKSNERIKNLSLLKKMSGACSKALFFESPHRFSSCLEDIKISLGDPEIFVARELTKSYESFYWGSCSQLLADIPESEIKGEFVIAISLKGISEAAAEEIDIDQKIRDLATQGLRNKEIQKKLQARSSMGSKELYAYIQNILNTK